MLYNIYLNFKNRIKEYTLPSVDNRRHIVDISSESGVDNCVLTFEIVDGVWRIISDEYVVVSSDSDEVLEDGKKITINICRSSVSCVIIVTAVTENMYRFRKYLLDNDTSIGSSDQCNIVIPGEYVSKKHAVITRINDRYIITDYSKNGLYINGFRSSKKTELNNFDSIYFFGTRIVFLGNVIAINNSENICVSLSSGISYQSDCSIAENSYEKIKENVYMPSLPPKPVTLTYNHQKPAEGMSSANFSDVIKISVISSAILTAALSLNSHISAAATMMCFAGVSASLGGVIFFLHRIYRHRSNIRNSLTLMSGKRLYLEKKEKEIKSVQQRFRDVLEIKYENTEKIINSDESTFWKIKRDDKDFLKIRLGKGKIDFSDYISDMSDDDDIHQFCTKYSTIDDAVVTLSLYDQKLICITAERQKIHQTVDYIAFELSACFDYRDVCIMSLFSIEDYSDFSWMRWIPHTFSDDRRQRYIAFSEKSHKNILYVLTSKLEKRTDQRNEGFNGRFYPHFIVFCSSHSIIENESIQKYINSSENIGVTFIIMYQNSESVPAICSTVISGDHIIRPYDADNYDQKIIWDIISHRQADEFARRMLRYFDQTNNFTPVPEQETLFDMLEIRDICNIDLAKRYKVNRAYENIKAAIGIGKNKKVFEMDIHEKKHGPHGLIAGTTGSGKSEALQTLIISLALNYNPDEIAFVLVDYKGGGMSDAFEKLPHTAGIITNLTDSLENGCNQARRVLISLKSELRRRQKLFKECRINHIDTYMRLRRDGKVSYPIPHIIIIVDEFAELKKEQPDFISQLISISRIGRSLGFHLILATQKPSGVVDDEIWSNSRFRLCLRVQDKTESTGILRRPDASELTVTGRAYIQIGNNEIFEMIQTAYSGAVYDPENSSVCDVCMIEDDASESVITISDGITSGCKTQLSTAVGYIIEVCTREKIKSASKLWIEPLQEVIMTEDISVCTQTDWSSGLLCIAGKADDPENQSVCTVLLNLYTDSNIIIAGCTGSGKTTLIKNMLYWLVHNYSPDKFRLQIFDFVGGLFEVFRKLPHCSQVCTEISEAIIGKFFSDIMCQMVKRKHLFEKSGVPDYNEYIISADDLPAYVIVFDGYGIFKELFPQMEEKFAAVTSECVKYGIYFITSVKSISEMKFRTRYNFRTIIPLTLSDRTEYAEVLGKNPSFEIPHNPGRGYVKRKEILEFQGLLFCSSSVSKANTELGRKFDQIRSRYANVSVSQTDEIDIPESAFCFYLKNIDDQKYINVINKFSSGASQSYLWTADSTDLKTDSSQLFSGAEGAYELLLKLKHIFSLRRDQRKNKEIFAFEKVAVVIYDMDDFCRCIYQDKTRQDMSNITEIFFENGHDYGVQFISRISDVNKYTQKAYRIFMSYNTGADYA